LPSKAGQASRLPLRVGTFRSEPTGFLAPAKVAQATWSWGKLGYLATGVAGNF
jgi:predicted phage gp36 major capsid-like protein